MDIILNTYFNNSLLPRAQQPGFFDNFDRPVSDTAMLSLTSARVGLGGTTRPALRPCGVATPSGGLSTGPAICATLRGLTGSPLTASSR